MDRVAFRILSNIHDSTGATDRSFYPIFNKKFGHLETLLTIHRLKNVLTAGLLCRPLLRSPYSKSPKRTLLEPYSKSPKRTFHITQKVLCFSFIYVIIAI